MSLVEVLAALALLGLLLSATLVAVARHTRQVRGAQDRLAAFEVADRLLDAWLVEGRGNLPGREGLVDDNGRAWRWRLVGRDEPELAPLGAWVARLEVTPAERPPEGEPSASVEFVSTATSPTYSVEGAP